MIKQISIILALLLPLTACQDGGMNKQGAGTALGAVAGGVIGSAFGKGDGQFAAILLGAAAGAFIGNSIGASLDKADQAYYTKSGMSTFESTPSGHTTNWKNPDSGNHGSFTPTKTYQSSSRQYCREFTQKGYGTACRNPDGTWKIVQ